MEKQGTSSTSNSGPISNFGPNSNFGMIDIGEKSDTQRRAIASGKFVASRETIARICNRSLPKGDALVLAEIAGIQAAKKTSDLLPLCHPLPLTSVRVWAQPEETYIQVFCEAKTLGKTGVEMEALCGVNAALLCIYDLTKGIDPVLSIGEIRLEIKEGGKSGQWIHPESAQAAALVSQRSSSPSTSLLQGLTAIVITLSDRCSKKQYEDRSGPIAARWLEEQGASVKSPTILPDEGDELRSALLSLLNQEIPHLIITSGGTGMSKRDITPDVVLELSRELGGREIPGIGELLRQEGAKHTKHAWLSRSTAVLVRDKLIVCLPGRPSAVREGLDAIGALLLHALQTHLGAGHETSHEMKSIQGTL